MKGMLTVDKFKQCKRIRERFNQLKAKEAK